MNDNEKKYEEYPNLFDKAHSDDELSETAAEMNLPHPRHPQKTSSQPKAFRPRKNISYMPEQTAQQNHTSQRHESIYSHNRKETNNCRQRNQIIIGFAVVAILIIAVLLIVKGCTGADALQGTWDYDGVTVYEFDGNGKGSLNLPRNTYLFTYKIKDNVLSIDFESNDARDCTYTFTIDKDKITLVGGSGATEPGKVYELTRQKG